MLSYAEMIRSIRQHEPLVRGIKTMVEKDGVLDLAVTNWRDRLQGNLLFQTYRRDSESMFSSSYAKPGNRSVVQKVKRPQHCFRIVLAGYWNFSKPESGNGTLQCSENEVVGEICNALSSDLASVYRRDSGARFFIENCSPFTCGFCAKGVERLRLTDPPPQMCIARSKIFDGTIVKNMFQSIFLSNQSTFLGVLSLVVNTRYFWNDAYDPSVKVVRVGGTIESCILFKPTSISPDEPLTFGDEDDACTSSRPRFSPVPIEENRQSTQQLLRMLQECNEGKKRRLDGSDDDSANREFKISKRSVVPNRTETNDAALQNNDFSKFLEDVSGLSSDEEIKEIVPKRCDNVQKPDHFDVSVVSKKLI